MNRYEAEAKAIGWREGWAARERFDRTLKTTLEGPDRTKYFFIGGPLDGHNIETGGTMTHRVPAPMFRPEAFWLDEAQADPPTHRTLDFSIARYEKQKTSTGWTAYVFKGWE